MRKFAVVEDGQNYEYAERILHVHRSTTKRVVKKVLGKVVEMQIGK